MYNNYAQINKTKYLSNIFLLLLLTFLLVIFLQPFLNATKLFINRRTKTKKNGDEKKKCQRVVFEEYFVVEEANGKPCVL